ncbi:FtsB family cell division protein [Alicyclobacillus pomorum]|uniref:FtsB family cell division protein n=1 Tax=Alicyclobacillus pomorum TaxID=204470 RepID=UPI00068824EB|nr:septum formation initiator family protein [Alicyclobacillus pomorum]
MSRIATLPVSHQSYPRGAKSPAPRRRKWFRLRYIALLAVCGWATYYYWHVQYPQLKMLSMKQAQLQQSLNAAAKQHAELVKQSNQLQDDSYIARYASEHYNLILPGQVAFDVKH